MQINKFFYLFMFLVSCIHKPVLEAVSDSSPSSRCVASVGEFCRGVLSEESLESSQTSVKDQLFEILSIESNWPMITARIDALLPQIERLSANGKLEPVLLIVARKALKMGKLPARLTAENLEENISLLSTSIENQFIAKGMSKKFPMKYISWLEASQKIRDIARKSSLPPVKAGEDSAFLNPIFVKELETAVGSEFKSSRDLRLLVNGPMSFPERERLIRGARKSVYIETWAMEDDVTGWKFARLLVERQKAGIDVRIIVDNKTARQAIYGKVPTWLKEQGVPVIFWKDPDAPMYAFHKKALTVDGETVLAGGMNFGDVYSHLGPPSTSQWRDTDFVASGNVALDSAQFFKIEWNSQIDKNKLVLSKFELDFDSAHVPVLEGGPRIMAIDQVPNAQVLDRIMISMIKGIEGATREINIENAYFIENPVMQQTLLRALKRGVKVNILTNSISSIDVPIIAKPILKALPILLRHGANIYLKKGSTVHSKFMTIDGVASWVMSYNLHPQSMRTQGEVAFVILDGSFTANLAEQFVVDTQTIADKVTDESVLHPPRNILDVILQRYFFDQL